MTVAVIQSRLLFPFRVVICVSSHSPQRNIAGDNRLARLRSDETCVVIRTKLFHTSDLCSCFIGRSHCADCNPVYLVERRSSASC